MHKCFAFQPWYILIHTSTILDESIVQVVQMQILQMNYLRSLENKCIQNYDIIFRQTLVLHIINQIKNIVAYLINVDGQYWLMHSWQNSAMTFKMPLRFDTFTNDFYCLAKNTPAVKKIGVSLGTNELCHHSFLFGEKIKGTNFFGSSL